MRNLRRNGRLIWYAKQEEFRELLDKEGNRTGQYKSVWPDQEEIHLYVSPAGGDAGSTLFGQELRYDRVMSTAWARCPIDEQTVLWIDADPVDDPYDYVVVKRAVWKNSAVYAIRRVDVHDANFSAPDNGGNQPGDPAGERLAKVGGGENPAAE